VTTTEKRLIVLEFDLGTGEHELEYDEYE